ncbi:MAG: acetate kinase [Prevotellaceae bacterium]|jgi:acetate kinase|nr:acetate kinase [Prevotellaceae bacterium]
MVILVLNCGSSSIKYQIMKMDDAETSTLLAKGIVERIGLAEGAITHKPSGRASYSAAQPIPDHTTGINLILSALVHPEHGVIASLDEVNAVGHRVVHGGEYFTESALVDENVKAAIEKCAELAPLHNPANLQGILSMEALLPKAPQVAVFDTSFHQTMPRHAYLYAIPYRYYEKYRIRCYGFHGTSHQYVAQKACKILGLDFSAVNIVTCHLGNGASITSIKQGKSCDTSMGFTPVDGLIMGTRSGAIDPGALLYIAGKENMSFNELNDLINKQGGMYGISGLSSDMRDLGQAAHSGNEMAQLARDMFVYRIRKFIGAHVAAMGKVDIIVFTGGVGENDDWVRASVCSNLDYLGVEFDSELNREGRGKDMLISKPSSKVKIMAVSTNEELVIAMDTMNAVRHEVRNA